MQRNSDHMDKYRLCGLTLVVTFSLLTTFPMNAYAIGRSVSGSHSTAHPVASHPMSSTPRASSPVRSTGGVTRSINTSKTSTGSRLTSSNSSSGNSSLNGMKNGTQRSSQSHQVARAGLVATSKLGNTRSANEAIQKTIKHDDTFKNLNSEKQQTSYLFWRGWLATYMPELRPVSVWNGGYYWMPYWMLHDQQVQNKQAQTMKDNAASYNMKWIRVGDKAVCISDKLYNRIKIGDHVKLIDQYHLQINEKTYRQ